MNSVVAIHLLGPLEISVDGSLCTLSYRRVEAALVFLVMESTASKAKLLNLLWPEAETRKARANLRHILYSLRQAGFKVSSNRDTVELCKDNLAVDVEKIGESPEVWRGEFCEGLFLDDSPEFEEWLLLQRESIRGKHFEGLMEQAKTLFARTHWEDAIRLANAAGNLDPLELAPQRLILQALANSGQRSALQKRLASLSETYQAELGASLPEEFLLPVVPLKGRRLPESRDSFVGRRGVVANFLTLLKRERLITLTGPPGVGKTRLATEALSRQNRDVILLDLTTTDSRDFKNVLLDQYLPRALRNDSSILLLDGCEHLLGLVSQAVERLLRKCPMMTVVVASREALSARCEFILPVEPLDPESAMSLFRDRVERAGATLPSSAEVSALEVCNRLDRLPHAIELLARRVKIMTVDQIAERLDDAFPLLRFDRGKGTMNSINLGAPFDRSFELLSDALRERFLVASYLSSDFTLETIKTLWGVDEWEALDTLQQLVGKSILSSSEGVFTFLRTVRLYGNYKSKVLGTEGQCRDRLFDWIGELSLDSKKMKVLEANFQSVRETLEWAVDARPSLALQRILEAEVFWCRFSRKADACKLLERCLNNLGIVEFHRESPQKAYQIFQKLIEKLPEKDKKVRPLAFANLGYSALELARFKEAYEFLETAQGLQEKKSENRFADAFILAGKACVRCAEGFYEQASSLLASAESAWSELSVPSRSALAQHYGPVKKRLVEALSDSR